MRRSKGFTLIELLTVIAIIAVLLGILVPSFNMVRRVAKKTEQKSQFNAIEQGIIAFKQDYGDYPPSFRYDDNGDPYCGAMTLTEALLGWDLMGFHPESQFVADGYYVNGGAYDADEDDDSDNLKERRGRYIDIDSVDVQRYSNVYRISSPGIDAERYVICDVFEGRRIDTSTDDTKKVGTPIVYFKANTSNDEMYPYDDHDESKNKNRYNYYDNYQIFNWEVYGKDYNHDLDNSDLNTRDIDTFGVDLFYSDDTTDPEYQYKIVDKEVTEASGRTWPHRPDSYILISAGPDHNFGTEDDITNF